MDKPTPDKAVELKIHKGIINIPLWKIVSKWSEPHWLDSFVRPWPVRVLYVIRDFWLREWKWILGFILATVGAFQLFR